ncbi:MAG: hypothetical protein R3F59_27945 [Myxococcota bacterium]
MHRATVVSGCWIVFTPAATAISHSPLHSVWQARCSATRDEEQAVSTENTGPRKSKWYASRADKMVMLVPTDV